MSDNLTWTLYWCAGILIISISNADETFYYGTLSDAGTGKNTSA